MSISCSPSLCMAFVVFTCMSVLLPFPMPHPALAQDVASATSEVVCLTSMISKPVTASIRAQAQAGTAAFEAFAELGFLPALDANQSSAMTSLSPLMVDFLYEQPGPNNTARTVRFQMPFLLMLPLPHVVIDRVSARFNIRVDSFQSESLVASTASAESATVTDANKRWRRQSRACGAIGAQGQRKGNERASEHHMNSFLTARSAPMPGGMGKVLDVLDTLITVGDVGEKDGRVATRRGLGQQPPPGVKTPAWWPRDEEGFGADDGGEARRSGDAYVMAGTGDAVNPAANLDGTAFRPRVHPGRRDTATAGPRVPPDVDALGAKPSFARQLRMRDSDAENVLAHAYDDEVNGDDEEGGEEEDDRWAWEAQQGAVIP